VKRWLMVPVVLLAIACIALPFAMRARQPGALVDHAPAWPPPAATTSTIADARRMSVSAFKSLQAADRVLVVDVRIERSFKADHIPGALNVPVDEVEARAPEILRRAAGRPIVTYCSCVHEHTSAVAAEALVVAGAKDVSALLGGYPAWVAQGGRVER
jgi:rhodanese-related sulfurtransferase